MTSCLTIILGSEFLENNLILFVIKLFFSNDLSRNSVDSTEVVLSFSFFLWSLCSKIDFFSITVFLSI